MKTHKYDTEDEHKKYCPKWNIKNKTGYGSTLVCDGCLISTKVKDGMGFKTYCHIEKFSE